MTQPAELKLLKVNKYSTTVLFYFIYLFIYLKGEKNGNKKKKKYPTIEAITV